MAGPLPLLLMPSISSCYCLLHRCGKSKDVQSCRRIYHGLLNRSGLALHSFLANHLIRMFALCGSLTDANHVFTTCIPSPDAFTWSAIISAMSGPAHHSSHVEDYRHHDDGDDRGPWRIQQLCYAAMMDAHAHADVHVLSSALTACARLGDVRRGRLIHAHIIHVGLECASPSMGNSLLGMYAKCASMEDAFRMLEALSSPCRDLITWGTLISACVQHGNNLEALNLFIHLQHEGLLKPNEFILSSAIKACSMVMSAWNEGQIIHMNVVENGFQADGFIGSCLIHMYANHGSVRDAWTVFSRLSEKDVVTWTSMIDAFIHHGIYQGAFDLFIQMGMAGIEVTQVTFLSIVKVFSTNKCLGDGMLLHAYLIETGIRMDKAIGSAFIDFYNNCFSLPDACSVFEGLYKRDVVIWDAMLSGCVAHGNRDAALQYFLQMQWQGLKPSTVTFIIILQIFSMPGTMISGKLMHAQIVENGHDQDAIVGNSLINMYSKQGSIIDACVVFDALVKHDVVTWSALISGHIEQGYTEECLELFQEMYGQDIQPDETILIYQLRTCSSSDEGKLIHAYAIENLCYLTSSILNALIYMYGEVEKKLDDAAKTFDMCVEKDVATCTSMIQCLSNSGHSQEALQIYIQMQKEGIYASQLTFVSALKACSSLPEGKQVHTCLMYNDFDEDLFIANSLLDMYTKCGDLFDACATFEKLLVRDTVTWNIIIAHCLKQSNNRLVLDYFEDMRCKGMKPDGATFSSLLSACNHIGLVQEGCRYFMLMQECYGIVPTCDHFNIILDLLGQAGWLKEADGFVQSAPFPLTHTTWFSLLRHCRSHGNISLGRTCFNQLIGLNG